ncbi:MAG: hypothetical protein KC609_16165 [Myxococcales bacterium]|nr:hypothetical protein [Myxococcales bacterium]
MTLLWAVAFAWTCAIELPIYGYVLRRDWRSGLELALIVLALNLVTHPAFNFWLPRILDFPGWEIVGELVVALVEGALLTLWLRWRASTSPWWTGWGAAFAANLVSALASFPFAWIFGAKS